MHSAQRQDERFDALYRAHFDAISRYCLRRLPVEDARDATTDVFETAWRKFDRVTDHDELLPWLYGVAHNVIRNRLRSTRRHLRLISRLASQPTSYGTDPADQVLLSKPGRSVQQAMDRLPESDQEILRLRAYEELTIHEVSLVLECSADAAKKRSSRALQRLRAAVENIGSVDVSPSCDKKGGDLVMNDQELLDVLATTDRYPATRPLPDGWSDGDSPNVDRHDAQGSATMSTTRKQRPVEPETTTPTRWRGALAAIAALIVAIAAITIINSGPDGADAPTTTIAPSTTVAPNLETEAGRIAFAEAIAEAFYSFDELALVDAIGTDVASTLIYVDQARSHALNSQVVERQPCDATTPSQVMCEVTSVDDFTDAFGLQQVERMTVAFSNDAMLGVLIRYSGMPRYLDDLWPWLEETHPNVMNVACDGEAFGTEAFGRDDPDGCWSAILEVVPEFIASDAYTGPPVP